MIAMPRVTATPLTSKDTPMAPAEKHVLTVPESCFKNRPRHGDRVSRVPASALSPAFSIG